MKINIFLTLISVALALLVGYLAYSVAAGDLHDVVCGVGSTICFIATLIPSMALTFESSKVGANVRVLSVLFFVVFLISHFCFAGFGVKMPYYIICNGLILLVYLAIVYKMSSIKSI